jgi:hypothetical protein
MTNACAPASGCAQMGFGGGMSYGDRPGLDAFVMRSIRSFPRMANFCSSFDTRPPSSGCTPGSIAIRGMADLCERAKTEMELEDCFRLWRFGVWTLRRMLEIELFPDLWHLRINL